MATGIARLSSTTVTNASAAAAAAPDVIATQRHNYDAWYAGTLGYKEHTDAGSETHLQMDG